MMSVKRFAAALAAVATLSAGLAAPSALADDASAASGGSKALDVNRLSGSTRYDTMAALVGRGGWSKGGTVVVASGANWPDALAATGYAGTLDAPIVLTDPGALSSQAAAQLKALAPKRVVVAGGPAAVSAKVAGQLKGYASRVDRVYGDTRVDTANAMYSDGSGWGKTIVLATSGGYADALSVGSYAYHAKAPVMLVDGTLSSSQESVLRKGGFGKVLVVGGVNAVSQAVSDRARALTGVEPTRLGGDTRYETSARIADWTLSNGLKMQDAVFASGSNFPDALAAGPLAGRTGSPVLLVDQSNGSAQEVVRDHKSGVSQVWVAGGPAAVPDSVVDSVRGALTDVRQVTTGNGSYTVKSDGSLWTWGSNRDGNLGVGDRNNRNRPVRVAGVGNVSTVRELGYLHLHEQNVAASVFAVTEDGSLYAWGSNELGQLGVGDKKDRLTPVRVKGVGNVSTITSDEEGSTFAVTKDGSLYSWGGNDHGQLGVGDRNDRLTPAKVLDNISTVSAEYYSAFAVGKDGSLYSWGRNSSGRLGVGDKNDRLAPAKILDNVSTVSYRNYGDVSWALTKDGSLYTWGRNSSGQLGVGDRNERLVPTYVTGDVSNITYYGSDAPSIFAVKKDGSLYAWGDNLNGRLGVGDRNERLAPTLVQGVGNVATVSVSYDSTVAVTKNGSLYAWGGNSYGELGTGDYEERLVPTLVQGVGNVATVKNDDSSVLAVTEDGSLYEWGKKYDLKGEKSEYQLTPKYVTDNVASLPYWYVLKRDGSLWKLNIFKPVKMLDNVSTVIDGTYAVTKDGSLYAWGYNYYYGNLGVGDEKYLDTPVRVM